MNTKKKHGWVVFSKNTGSFIRKPFLEVKYDEGYHYIPGLENAHVFATRKLAREEQCTPHERIGKVSVGEDGKAIEIIPGR